SAAFDGRCRRHIASCSKRPFHRKPAGVTGVNFELKERTMSIVEISSINLPIIVIPQALIRKGQVVQVWSLLPLLPLLLPLLPLLSLLFSLRRYSKPAAAY